MEPSTPHSVLCPWYGQSSQGFKKSVIPKPLFQLGGLDTLQLLHCFQCFVKAKAWLNLQTVRTNLFLIAKILQNNLQLLPQTQPLMLQKLCQ